MNLKIFTLLLLSFSGTLFCQIPMAAPSTPNKTDEIDSIRIEYFDSEIKMSPIEPLTLEGTDNSSLGLSLEVTFYVDGNKIKIPIEVSFVFYSNARVARFPNQLAKKVTLMDSTKRIKSVFFAPLNTKKEKKLIHEVIAGEYSFEVFKKFVEAKQPILLLGKHKFELTDAQVNILMNMVKIIESR